MLTGWKSISDVNTKEKDANLSNEFKTLISDDTLCRGFSGTGKTWTAVAKALYTAKLYKDEIPVFILDTENVLGKVQYNKNWNTFLAKTIGVNKEVNSLVDLGKEVGAQIYISPFNEKVGSEKVYDTIVETLQLLKQLPQSVKENGYDYGILIIDSLTDIYKLTSMAVIQNRVGGSANEVETVMDNVAQIQDWNKVSSLMYDSIVTLTMNSKILTLMTMKEKENPNGGDPSLQGYKDMPYYCDTYVRCFVGQGLVGGKVVKRRKYEIRKTWGLTGDSWPVIDADFTKLINIILGRENI